MLESFRQCCNIVLREQLFQVCGLGRITPKDLDRWTRLHDSRHFVACQENRDLAIWTRHPLYKISLRMRIRPIDFIQNQAERICVSSQEGRDAA